MARICNFKEYLYALVIFPALLVVCAGSAQANLKTEENLWEAGATLSQNTDESSAGPMSDAAVIDVLDLKDMDIIDVLKLISQKSGLNIVAGQNVKGPVTVFLKDVGVHEALKIIAYYNEMHPHASWLDGSVLWQLRKDLGAA